MTTLAAPPATSSATIGTVQVQRVTPARVLHSEWIKLRSLRSTGLTLLAAVVTMVAMGWIIAWATNRNCATPSGSSSSAGGAARAACRVPYRPRMLPMPRRCGSTWTT